MRPCATSDSHGPVNAQEHYVVSRRVFLLKQLTAQIEQGKFFTIYAPRQMGKTTPCCVALDTSWGARPDFLAIALSFEAYESWPLSDFWADFSERMAYQLSTALPGKNQPNSEAIAALLAGQMAVDERSFQRFFRQLYQLAPTLKVVLIIDEFDATPQAVLSPLLANLAHHVSGPPAAPQPA